MGESVSFDRAAEYYDRTRALPGKAHDAVIGTAAAELADRGRVLEVGVGTGRIGLSLAGAGVPLVGLDLSLPMLRRLIDNAGATPLPVLRGDATALPFGDATFGAGVASHVFHLVPRWRSAVAELARVVRPGGALLVTRGSPPHPLGELVLVAWDTLGSVPLPGVVVVEEIDEFARQLGLGVRTLEPVMARGRRPPRAVIDQTADRQWGWSWELSDEQVATMVEAMTRAAVERWGSVDEPVEDEQVVQWHVYDVPS